MYIKEHRILYNDHLNQICSLFISIKEDSFSNVTCMSLSSGLVLSYFCLKEKDMYFIIPENLYLVLLQIRSSFKYNLYNISNHVN